MTKENNNNNKDRNPTTYWKEGYFTGWRRKNPRYNKWGATLTDSKESHKKKRCKKRKYDTEDPNITLTEDDAELVT
jgi:hypothetical protein